LLIVKVWALVDAAMRPQRAFVAEEKQTKTFWLVVLGIAVLVTYIGLFTILGLIALIVGAIYVWVRLVVVAPAVVVENERGMGAIRRSWDLVQDNWWRIFGTLIVVGMDGSVSGMLRPVAMA